MIKAASIKRVSREIERGIKKHESALAKGIVRGLNKSATSVRKISVDEVRNTLNVKSGEAKKSFVVQRASRRKLRMSVGARYKRLPITAFAGTRFGKKGVTARPRKDKGRLSFPGAFRQTVGKGGHKGAFYRSPHANKWTAGRPRTSSPNLPIKEIYGPPVRTVFADKVDAIQRKSDPVIDKTLNREIAYALSQR